MGITLRLISGKERTVTRESLTRSLAGQGRSLDWRRQLRTPPVETNDDGFAWTCEAALNGWSAVPSPRLATGYVYLTQPFARLE